MQEIWKGIKGYEGYYEVSNRGKVRSLDRTISGKHYKGKLKSIHIDSSGYSYVTLCKDMISTRIHIHRLVAEAFIPNPDNKREVDHINTIRHDNRVQNLRWVTRKENANNPITKRRVYIEAHKKESLERSQLTRIKNNRKTARKKVYKFSIDGTLIKIYDSVREAAMENKCNASDITGVCKNSRGRRSIGGYLWSFTDKCNEYKPYALKQKKLAQYDKNGNLIKIWDSYKLATETLGISNISRATKSTKKPIAGGFMWKYL